MSPDGRSDAYRLRVLTKLKKDLACEASDLLLVNHAPRSALLRFLEGNRDAYEDASAVGFATVLDRWISAVERIADGDLSKPWLNWFLVRERRAIAHVQAELLSANQVGMAWVVDAGSRSLGVGTRVLDCFLSHVNAVCADLAIQLALIADIDPSNIASRGLARKLGFEQTESTAEWRLWIGH